MKTTADTGEVIGFGAAALDFYRPLGAVGPDYEPGKKVGWTEEDQASLGEMMYDGSERHVGGNALNVLAYLSRQESYRNIGFVSVLGSECEVSDQIYEHINRLGIDTSRLILAHGYNPSVSIVERDAGDRMVRGRPRGLMPDYIEDEHIKSSVAGSGLVVAASLKSPELTRQIFELTPDDTPISYNPGSSEFRDYPEELRRIMELRRPHLLALNETEIAQLYGVDAPSGPKELTALAERATGLADFVLCTAGKDGIVLASAGDSIHGPARMVEPVDTLGAGDRAHAVAIHGLMQGANPEEIVDKVARSTAQVVSHRGAHGDLYQFVYA